jgi:hypothetical protein
MQRDYQIVHPELLLHYRIDEVYFPFAQMMCSLYKLVSGKPKSSPLGQKRGE